jgi:tripartite-type tricarboxylate transporter receptor subunit TctC
VPTMAEAGLPGVETSLWFGLFAPTGTPRAIVDKIAATAKQAMHTEAALGTLHKLGDDPLDAGPDEFAKFMKSEIARWTKVANVAGIKKG